MMRYVILVLLIVLGESAFSQKEKSLVGKWEIIAYETPGMHIDFVKDSIALIGDMAAANTNSTLLHAVKEAAKIFMTPGFYSFSADSNLVITMAQKTDGIGPFQADAEKGIINAFLTRGNVKVEDQYIYSFKGDNLILSSSDDDGGLITLILKKVE